MSLNLPLSEDISFNKLQIIRKETDDVLSFD